MLSDSASTVFELPVSRSCIRLSLVRRFSSTVTCGVQWSGDARGDCLIDTPLPNFSIEQWRVVVIVTGSTLFVTSQKCACVLIDIFTLPAMLINIQAKASANPNYFCRQKNISGKAVTPYILQYVNETTGGKSLQASMGGVHLICF